MNVTRGTFLTNFVRIGWVILRTENNSATKHNRLDKGNQSKYSNALPFCCAGTSVGSSATRTEADVFSFGWTTSGVTERKRISTTVHICPGADTTALARSTSPFRVLRRLLQVWEIDQRPATIYVIFLSPPSTVVPAYLSSTQSQIRVLSSSLMPVIYLSTLLLYSLPVHITFFFRDVITIQPSPSTRSSSLVTLLHPQA